MSEVLSKRYGNLARLSAKTDDRCHLCHEEVDIAFYGAPGSFGPHTVTVDHLLPQAHGGNDDHDNLLLAHATCNIFRGTRDIDDVRLELSGTADKPLSATAKDLLSIGAGGLAFARGGTAFAKVAPDGTKQFNREAAALTALVVGIVTRIML